MDRSVLDTRAELERAWQAGVVEHRPAPPVRPEVLASWQRSGTSVRPAVSVAPVDRPEEVVGRWATSPLGRASRVVHDDLVELAAGGDMMAVITDDRVRIAWLAGGRTMSGRAERVGFCIGGRWSEDAVGTNALGLSCATGATSTVYSAEHFAPMVHDWVCYSAPIADPHSGRFLGVIDLSTWWERASPALLTTVGALARCVEYELRSQRPAAGAPGAAGDGITLHSAGMGSLAVDGHTLAVTPRQLEILIVLSLHPDGLTLDELTGRVYGDHPVSLSTVKAELSRLRHLLGGRIGSRPYRIVGPCCTDHGEALDAIATGDLGRAVALCARPPLPTSESPELRWLRHRLEASLRDAVLGSGDPQLLDALSAAWADDTGVHQATIAALPPWDRRRSLAVGRLAAAASPA